MIMAFSFCLDRVNKSPLIRFLYLSHMVRRESKPRNSDFYQKDF